MGCGASKSVGVIEVKPCKAPTPREKEEKKTKSATTLSLIPLIIDKKKKGNSADSGISSNKSAPAEPYDSDVISDRKSSISSTDSVYEDEWYKKIITEKSKKNLTAKVEKEFVERNLELSVVGRSCPPLLTKKEVEMKKKEDEEKSIEILKDNGLVQKPIVMKQNYALFEIVEEKLLARSKVTDQKLPPLIQREKTKPTLTAQELEEKLNKASQRRQEMLNNVRGSVSLDKKTVKFSTSSDKSSAVANVNNDDMNDRMKKLKDLRDKLKAKDVNSGNSNNNAANSVLSPAGTPRTKELLNEYNNFRPKTPSNFKAEFS